VYRTDGHAAPLAMERLSVIGVAGRRVADAWRWFAAPVLTPMRRWLRRHVFGPLWKTFVARAAWTWPDGQHRGKVAAGLIGGALTLALTLAMPLGAAVAIRGPAPARVSGFPDSCPAFGAKAEKGLTPDAILVLRCVHAQFPAIKDFGGNYAAGAGSDHNTGRAVDSMVPGWQTSAGNNLGWQVAYWEQAHAQQLGITYLIFDDHIWSVQRNAEGWRKYTNPYHETGPSARHLNHVHTSVKGNAATIVR
jgi:hypothetical protein